MKRDWIDPVLEASACSGKQPFNHARAKEVSKRSPNNLHAYKCPICKAWHVGHSPLKRKS